VMVDGELIGDQQAKQVVVHVRNSARRRFRRCKSKVNVELYQGELVGFEWLLCLNCPKLRA